MPQHKANKTLGEDLSPAVPCPKALPPSHTASRDHPGVDCVEVGRRSLRIHTGWSGKRQKWLELCWFLFFINKPVGMCHSATELNHSCCSSRTTAPSRPRSSLICPWNGVGQTRGHLLHLPGNHSAAFFPGSCLLHAPPLGIPNCLPQSSWKLGFYQPHCSLASVTQPVTFSTQPNDFENLFWF